MAIAANRADSSIKLKQLHCSKITIIQLFKTISLPLSIFMLSLLTRYNGIFYIVIPGYLIF